MVPTYIYFYRPNISTILKFNLKNKLNFLENVLSIKM